MHLQIGRCLLCALALAGVAGCASAVDETAVPVGVDHGQALSISAITREIGLGDRGSDVAAAHHWLTLHGYLPSIELEQRYPFWAPVVDEEAADPGVFGPAHAKAILAFQQRSNLPESGFLDATTLETMKERQCGRPENELAGFDSSEKWYIHTNEVPLWTKTTLKFKISGCPKDAAGACIASQGPIQAAFDTWKRETKLDFSVAGAGVTADYDIKFVARNACLDGTTTCSCTNFADCHYSCDASNNCNYNGWAQPRTGAVQTITLLTDTPGGWTAPNLQYVALHEIGHSLGLGHTSLSNDYLVGAGPLMGSPAMYVGSGRNNGLVLAMDDRAAVMTRYSVWKALSGIAIDIAVGGSQPTSPVIWVTSGNNTVWSLVNNTPVQDPNGNGSAIAVTKAGIPWTVTSSNTVKRRANATCNTGTNACSGTWTQVGSSARDIAIGSSSVWIISNTATSGGNFAVQTWNGTLTGDGSFVAPSAPMDGVRITVTGNTPCVVKLGTNSVGGSVFCKSSNSTWSELKAGTCASDIGAGFFNGGIYALDCNNGQGGNHGVWIWNSNQATNPNTQFGNVDFGPTRAAAQWVNFDGLAARIAVGPDGRPYAVQASSGGIFRRDPR